MRHTYTILLLLSLLLTACHKERQAVSATPTATITTPSPHPTAPLAAAPAPPRPVPYPIERRYNELYLESVRQKQAEHIDAQYELLSAALHLRPDAPEAVYDMGMLCLSYSPYSDPAARTRGDSLLRLSVSLDPQNTYYKESLGTYLAGSARYREAIRIYEDIADTRADEQTLTTLTALYKADGDYAGAIRTLDRLEQKVGPGEELSMEKFQTYIAMKDDEHAYLAIEDLCAQYPYDLRYRVLLGDLYDSHGHHERALDIYRDVLTAEPTNPYAQLSLLSYYKAAGADSLYLNHLQRVVLNPQTQSTARIEALRTYALDNLQSGADSLPVLALFRSVLALDRDTRDVAELQVSYLSLRHLPTDTLLSAIDNLLQVAPDHTTARLQKLQILIQRRQAEPIVQICREGELYDPAEVTYYFYEGIARYLLGQNQAAIIAFQNGAERIDEQTDPLLASDLLANLGDVLYTTHLADEAFSAYDRALAFNPSNYLCLNNYAYYLTLHRRHLDRALQMSQRAVSAEPTNATYLDTHAWVLYTLGRYAEADTIIHRALQALTPEGTSHTYYDHAGDIAYRLRRTTQALQYWRTALRLATGRNERRAIQRKINRRRI